MARIIDLDAAAAGRAEAQLEGPTVRFKGEEFVLPPELPFGVVEGLADLATAKKTGDEAVAAMAAAERRNDPSALERAKAAQEVAAQDLMVAVRDIAEAILGADAKRFADLRPSSGDLEALVEQVMPAYLGGAGEGDDVLGEQRASAS